MTTTEVIITEKIVDQNGKVISSKKMTESSSNKRRKPKMDMRTSYGREFIKPESSGKSAWDVKKMSNTLGKGKFNGRTTYNSEFVKREKLQYGSDKGNILVEYSSTGRDRIRPKFRASTTYNAGFCGGV